MGYFTAYDNPDIDSLIGSHMQIFKKICIEELGSNLLSIVLSGSFGRGEGSVLIENNRIEPLRDYDLRIILKEQVSKSKTEKIRIRFMEQMGLGNKRENFSGEHGFSITLEPLSYSQLITSFIRDRDLRVYDHINASHVIFGEDFSIGLRFPAAEIPKINGLRLLYQKMIGLIGHFSELKKNHRDAKRTLLYECDKTFIEICTALSLLAGKYQPSYKLRLEWFLENWRADFPSLAFELPELGHHVERATLAKLYPNEAKPLMAKESFFLARKALLTVHQYYILRLFNQSISPNIIDAKRLLKSIQHTYFKKTVEQVLRNYHLNYPTFRWIINNIYQYYLRFTIVRGENKISSQMILETFRFNTAPRLVLFVAAWLTLEAAEEKPDLECLDYAEQILDSWPLRYQYLEKHSDWVYFSLVRNNIIQMYRLCEKNDA